MVSRGVRSLRRKIQAGGFPLQKNLPYSLAPGYAVQDPGRPGHFPTRDTRAVVQLVKNKGFESVSKFFQSLKEALQAWLRLKQSR
jgi:hypothetical protein